MKNLMYWYAPLKIEIIYLCSNPEPAKSNLHIIGQKSNQKAQENKKYPQCEIAYWLSKKISTHGVGR